MRTRKITTLLIITVLCALGCNPPLSKRHVLIIGDDHAADKNGWVYYFQQQRKGGPLVNAAVKGGTTAFPNPGQPLTNTLDQLVPNLRRAFAEMGDVDEVIIQLGTNDCRAEYQAGSIEQQVSYRKLITGVNDFFAERGQEIPRLTLVTPPPIGKNPDAAFTGGAECVRALAGSLQTYAASEGLCFVNLLDRPALEAQLNPDGYTYSTAGYELMARAILKACY